MERLQGECLCSVQVALTFHWCLLIRLGGERDHEKSILPKFKCVLPETQKRRVRPYVPSSDAPALVHTGIYSSPCEYQSQGSSYFDTHNLSFHPHCLAKLLHLLFLWEIPPSRKGLDTMVSHNALMDVSWHTTLLSNGRHHRLGWG